MRERKLLPPLGRPRPSPRLVLRADLSADHQHPFQTAHRAMPAVDYRESTRERTNLALSLLDGHTRASEARATAGGLVALTDILLGGILSWLTFETAVQFPASSLMRLAACVLGLLGLILTLVSLVIVMRVVLHWRGVEASTEFPEVTIPLEPHSYPGAPKIPEEQETFRQEFLGLTRRDFLQAVLGAVHSETRNTRAQKANLRRSAIFLILSFGVLVVMVVVASAGII